MSIGIKTSHLPPNDRVGYANAIFTRQILSAYAVYCLSYPTPRKEFKSLNNKIFYDFPSCFAILRCMYENLIKANFILLNDKFKVVKNIILDVASLHAVREQIILFDNKRRSSHKFQELKEKHEKLIDELKEHNEYNNLDCNIRKYIEIYNGKNNKWYPDKLEDIAVLAGFHRNKHLYYNKYYSNYIHSDPLSIKEVRAVRNSSDTEQSISSAIDCTINFLSMTLNFYMNFCNNENIIIELSEYSKGLIDKWIDENQKDLSRNKKAGQ